MAFDYGRAHSLPPHNPGVFQVRINIIKVIYNNTEVFYNPASFSFEKISFCERSEPTCET
jgi:hypothetical protein